MRAALGIVADRRPAQGLVGDGDSRHLPWGFPTQKAVFSALTLYPGAVESFDRALATDPGLAIAHAGKAQVLMREGKVAALLDRLAPHYGDD